MCGHVYQEIEKTHCTSYNCIQLDLRTFYIEIMARILLDSSDSIVMEDHSLKLDELSEKSAQKYGGSAAHYIVANVALRDDILSILSVKFDSRMNE